MSGKTGIHLSVLLAITFLSCNSAPESALNPVLVLHGGSGTITRENLSEDKEKAIREVLSHALNAGYEILDQNGSAVEAVEHTISLLEDSPFFNAGKGAVFASNGKNELDASIMDGKSLNAGAVSGVRHIKNPIKLARLVMDSSRHVLFYGEGAEEFARGFDIDFVTEDYFYTQNRWESFQRAKDRKPGKLGTVGVVALDNHGNLAAGTSTGGLTNKRFGRIGDSPIIGAGTYANNSTCAISATGTGEFFIRTTAAASVSALMELGHLSLQEAMDRVIHQNITELGGYGGLIGVDSKGNVAFSFNTEGMYRGYIRNSKEPVVMIYKQSDE